MKKAVLLVTLGGPRTLGEVNDFLVRFIGRELPPPAVRSAIERYRLIGGGSPLNSITENQALLLNQLLGEDFICLPTFRYMPPYIEDSIDLAMNSGALHIYFLSMSPYYATVTTGNYIDCAKRYISRLGVEMPITYIHSWHENEFFLKSWANKINDEKIGEDTFLLFSAHSLPVKYASDPYKTQIEQTVEKIVEMLDIKNFSLGWQSVPSNVSEEWFSPSVEDRIDYAVQKGFKKIVQVPVGFTADHIETLYDIDIIHRGYAEQRGVEFKRIPSLNTNDMFIKALEDIIRNVEKRGSNE